MDRQNQTDAAYRQQPVPAANAAPESRRMAGGDRVNPGKQPDEIVPNKPDIDRPAETPDEVQPGQGDFDRPDNAPIETPPQPGTAPAETPPPD